MLAAPALVLCPVRRIKDKPITVNLKQLFALALKMFTVDITHP